MSDAPPKPAKGPAKIRIENANHPGSSTSVDAGMYEAMRVALLAILPEAAPGLTESQIRARVVPGLPEGLFPAGARAGWWSKAVQLDLEAKGTIARESTRPLRWHHPAEPEPLVTAPPRPPRMPGGDLGRTRTRNTSSK